MFIPEDTARFQDTLSPWYSDPFRQTGVCEDICNIVKHLNEYLQIISPMLKGLPVHSWVIFPMPDLQGLGVTANGPAPQSVLSGEVHAALAIVQRLLRVCEGIDIEQQHPALGWKSLD